MRSPSVLELKFIRMWCGLSPYWLVPEHYGIAGRRFRFDFAEPSAKVAVEIQGGSWVRGRHVTGKGFEGECERRNVCQLKGWVVFELTGKMINPEWLYLIDQAIFTRRFARGLETLEAR